MNNRALCPSCTARPVAVNRHIGDKIYYRKQCDHCLREGRSGRQPTAWQRVGYKKKPVCEKCGFKAKFPEQLNVFYVDGNLKNNNHFNLKTVCLNCQPEVYRSRLSWKPAPLIPDF